MRELKKIYPSSKSKSSSSKIQLVSPDTNEQIPELDTANYVGEVDPINLTKNCSSSKNKSSHNKYTNKSRTIPQQVELGQEPPWSLSKFSEDEVLRAVRDIDVHKSSGLKHINNAVLKSILKDLIEQLTFILNLSLSCGSFPNSWKDALVIPIPKKGDLAMVSNYRPISLLPQPGKIVEKLVHNKLSE